MPDTQPPTSPTHASAQPDSTQLALERTYLAAERTLFAVLRTGLSIVAGGTVIVALLGEDWPEWVQGSLAGAFLVVGYALVFLGLRRYHGIAKHVKHQGGQRLAIRPGTDHVDSHSDSRNHHHDRPRAVLLQRLLVADG